MASTTLGGGGTLPSGSTNPIQIPNSEAPQKVLQQDVKIQMLQTPAPGDAVYDPYKLLATSTDTSPGYLLSKINSSYFSIVTNKLELSGFGILSTTDLNEGTNLYFTNARAISALSAHTGDATIHFSDLSGFDSDNLSEGTTNLYLNSTNFSSFLATKTTDDLAQGITNFYYTSAKFDASLATKTTDNLTEGVTNKYLSSAKSTEIDSNTSARHTHSNKTLLDSYTQSNSSIVGAITNSHTHSNKAILDGTEQSFTTALKAQYDALTATNISSVVSPLSLTAGVLSHLSTDGNKHVPTNSGKAQYSILTSGATAGAYTWETINTIITNVAIFDATPTTSTVKGVQSAYINTHVSNGTTDVKHVTDANLTYINTTIPAHIASTLLHLPSITPTTDQGKFLYINGSDQPAWTTSATNIQTAGQTYVTAVGDTITMSKISLAQTELLAGSNITFSTNTINATQRAITGTPSSGDSITCISSEWGYNHSNTFGLGGHVPTGGTSGQYLDGSGAWADFSSASGGIVKIEMPTGGPTGSIATRLAGTTFPSGWSGAVGTVTTDLVITHTAGKAPFNVRIWADDGTDKTMLIGSAAYSTILANSTDDEITIASLATINESIIIYIQFE